MIKLDILKRSWAPYVLILLFWILTSQFLSPWSNSYQVILSFTKIALTLSVVFIVYKTITDNKRQFYEVFFGFAKLSLLILGSYILVFFSGKTFSSEGGWLLLYALFPICLITAAALYAIGATMKYLDKYK